MAEYNETGGYNHGGHGFVNAVSGNPSLNEAPDQVEDEDMCTELMDASNGRVSETLSVMEQRLESKDMIKVLNVIHDHSDKWQNIGLGLGFHQPELNYIQSMPTLLHDAPKSYLKELLNQWYQWPTKKHDQIPNIKVLCESLQSSLVGLGRLAEEVKKAFVNAAIKTNSSVKCGLKRSRAIEGGYDAVTCATKWPRIGNGNVFQTSELTRQPSEDENSVQVINKETRNIKLEFADLKERICDKITNKKKLILVLKRMEILTPDDMQSVEEADDVSDVFLVIEKYWSLLDYRYFAYIAQKLCSDAGRKMVEEYTAKLERFCRNRIVNCPPDCLKNDHQSDGRGNKIYVKLNLKILNVPVANILAFKCCLADILHLRPSDLILLSIGDGSILVTYMVLACVGDHIFEKGPDSLSSEQQTALKREHVTSLQYNLIVIYSDPQTSKLLDHTVSDSGLGQSEFSGVDYTRRSETSDDAEQSLLPSDHAEELLENYNGVKENCDSEETPRETDTLKGESSHRFVQCELCHKLIESCKLEIHLNDECPNRITPCPNSGCKWSGKQTDLASHIIICPYKCGKVVSRQSLEHHISDSECPERITMCPNQCNGCKWRGRVKDMDDHIKVCGYQEIELPNMCDESIKEDQLSHHLNNACPMSKSGTIEQCVDVCKDDSSVENTTSVHSQADAEDYDSQPLQCPTTFNKLSVRHDIETCIEEDYSRKVISCTNDNIGCTWRGKQSELSTHRQTCDFESIRCPNSCGNPINRCELAIHLRDQCPNRIVLCPNTRAGCGWSGQQTELTTHRKMCFFESLPCTYKCGKVISRKNLEHHFTECPERIIPCPNEKNGCIWKGKLNNLSIHKTICTHRTQKSPNKCGAYVIPQEDIEIKKNKDCTKRQVSCDNSRQRFHWKGQHSELAALKQTCERRSRTLSDRCPHPLSELDQQSDVEDDIETGNEFEGHVLGTDVSYKLVEEKRGTYIESHRSVDQNYLVDIDEPLSQRVPLQVEVDPFMVKESDKDISLKKPTFVKCKQPVYPKSYEMEFEQRELTLDLQQLTVAEVKHLLSVLDELSTLNFVTPIVYMQKHHGRIYLTLLPGISFHDQSETNFFADPNNLDCQENTYSTQPNHYYKGLLSWLLACLLQMMTKLQPIVNINEFLASLSSFLTLSSDEMKHLFAQFRYLMLHFFSEDQISKGRQMFGNLFKAWADYIDQFLNSEDAGSSDILADEQADAVPDYLQYNDPREQTSIDSSNTSNSLASRNTKHHFYFLGTSEVFLSLPSNPYSHTRQYQQMQQVTGEHFNMTSVIVLKEQIQQYNYS